MRRFSKFRNRVESLSVPDLDLKVSCKELCSGIFWVITESVSINDYKLLMFDIPCDTYGNPTGSHKIQLNAKSGSTYNHRLLWKSEIKNNSTHRPYNTRSYDYYPRGRVSIGSNKATIYLNPHINKQEIVDEIKLQFGLSNHNISEIRVVVDGSAHYKCFIDCENE